MIILWRFAFPDKSNVVTALKTFVQKQIILFEAVQHIGTSICDVVDHWALIPAVIEICSA
jgi:hypothetical protein